VSKRALVILGSIGWLLAIGATSVLWPRPSQPRPATGVEDIVFSVKVFYDSARSTGDGIVSIIGTLSGEGLAHKNNAVLVACYKDRRECLTFSVDQIGPNQVSRLEIPLPYQVVKWATDEVVATSGDAFDCRKVTISLVRKSGTAVWVEEPINQVRASCKDADMRLYKWTIGPGAQPRARGAATTCCLSADLQRGRSRWACPGTPSPLGATLRVR
jgi:hypothetical protein